MEIKRGRETGETGWTNGARPVVLAIKEAGSTSMLNRPLLIDLV